MEEPLPDPFSTKRLKMLSKPDGFMLYGKLGVDFFSTSELLYPDLKVSLRLTRTRPNFYGITDNPNVNCGYADCSLYIRHIALKDGYQKKRIDILDYTPVEFNFFKAVAKTFIIPARHNQFFQKTFSTMLQIVGLLLQ